MAVNIDVPGVGRIQVEGVASEAIMEKILSQLKAMDPKSGAAAEEAKARQESTKATEQQTQQITKTVDAQKKAEDESFKQAGVRRAATRQMLEDTRRFTVNLATNLTGLALSFGMMHDKIAADPISAGANLIGVGIDATLQATKVVTGGMKNLGEGIPIVGGIIKGLGSAAEAAAEGLAMAAKIANNFLSAELKKTTEALKTFTAAGASFAGGLTEMRQVANGSGLNLKAFTDVVKGSRDSILAMGLTVGEASTKLGAGMAQSMTQVGRSGQSLRNELLNMGYSYEEQGVVMAQYMAQQKASGQLEKMTTTEIAQGTREYARNLKVLSDITGEDAKKLMEKARQESMRGALMAKLQGDQQDAFKGAYSTLSSFGPEVQAALVQQLTGGTITDPVIAGNEKLRSLVERTAADIQSGNKNIIADTQRSMSETAQNMKSAGTSVLDTASVMTRGQAGMATAMANVENKVLSYQLDPDAAKKSNEAAESQATTIDKTSQGFSTATDAAMKFSVQMEELATKMMPKYSQLLGDAMVGMIDVMRKLGADIPETQLEMERRLSKEGENAAARQALQEAAAGSSMTLEGFGIPQYADGGIAKGPESGHLAMLHGEEAVIPIPEFAKLIAQAATLLSSTGTDASFGNYITVGNDFSEGIKSMFDKAMSQRAELEKTDEGRAEFSDAMKSMTDTLIALRQGKEGLASGISADRIAGGDSLLETNNRMISLFEQFVTKQDEMKREMELSRQKQELIANLL